MNRSQRAAASSGSMVCLFLELKPLSSSSSGFGSTCGYCSKWKQKFTKCREVYFQFSFHVLIQDIEDKINFYLEFTDKYTEMPSMPFSGLAV